MSFVKWCCPHFKSLHNLWRNHFKPNYGFCRGFFVSSSFRLDSSIIMPTMATILDKARNKGLCFTMEERQLFGLVGLIPPTFRTPGDQLRTCKAFFDSHSNPLDKYIYLMSLHSRNERLFFRFLGEYIEDCLPVVYTPTVGVACQRFGLIYHRPSGIYISKYDKGHIKQVLKNCRKCLTGLVITDGQRILGLGDLGANGMGISEGKLLLYTALGNVKPEGLMPIMLDVGTNNEQLICDPHYLGIREKRLGGQEYYELVDEFMETVVKLFGSTCLIQFEDFATPNAFRLLERYQNKYCCFNDDIQGTSAMGLAGILASKRITKKDLKDYVILFVGAGSAAAGIASLLLMQLIAEGVPKEEAACNIYLYDANGLVVKNKELPALLQLFAKDLKPIKKLEDVIPVVKPNLMIGATGVGKIFSEKVLTEMAKVQKQPIIFALSNPTSNSECTAEEAYRYTEGRCIFSGGSPFPPIVWEGKTFVPGQANNSFIFPGVAFGVMVAKAKHIPNEVFLAAAHTLANYTTEKQLKQRSLYPPIKEANGVAVQIAINVATYIFDHDLALHYPRPNNITQFVCENLYQSYYHSSIQPFWKYPPPMQ